MIALAATLPLFAASVEPRGWYVEARTAAVFAGACHHGAQSTLLGRDALLAWSIAAGEHQGVDLTGVEVAVLLRGDANLAEPNAARESWIFVDERDDPRRAHATVRWLAERHARTLGAVRGVHSVALDVDVTEGRYRATAPGLFELSGAPLPDRACCTMPQQVWYRPFVALDGALVGLDEEFRVSAKHLGVTFSRPEENGAIVGRFGPAL